jgi:hypothetical protein
MGPPLLAGGVRGRGRQLQTGLKVIWVHGGGLSAAKRDSLLAEYAVGCRHHVLIGASFTTICQAGAVDR